MRYLLLIISTLFWSYSMSGQQIQILHGESGKGLSFVTVSHEQSQKIASTSENGFVDISIFKGLDSIKVSSVGFKPEIISYQDLLDINLKLTLEVSEIELAQIIISANKWGQTKKEVPARVTTITPEDIAFNNPQTAADLLAKSGEVFIQKSQLGGGSPMIRGFSTNRLLISIDGVRMNNAIFRSGNLQNVISLDPLATESAEVLFGPSSVIYGSDAIGGVMSFSSLKPWLSFTDNTRVSSTLMTRYSSANNEKTIHGHVKLGWQKWASVTSISFSDYGDLRMGKNGGPDSYLRTSYVIPMANGEDIVVENENPLIQKQTGYNQFNILQKIRFKPTKNLDFTYSFHHSETSDVPRYDRLIRPGDESFRSAEWYYGPQKWQMHHLEINATKASKLYDKLTTRIAFQNYKESRHDRNFRSISLSENFEDVNILSGNIDAIKSIGKKEKLYYGLEAIYNIVNSNGRNVNIENNTTENAAARYPNSDWKSFAGYITYQRNLSEKWTAQGGIRYNHIDLRASFDQTFFPLPFEEVTVSNGAITGSVGFVYAPSQKWIWRGSVSSGFRAPNIDDVGKIFDSEPGAVVIPNPDLKPEYAYNAEISATHEWNKGNSVFVNGYYTQLENALVRRNFLLNGQDSIFYDGELSRVQAIQNAAKANVFGIEAGADLFLENGFGAKVRLNYQIGEEELDDGSTSPSRHAPPPFGQFYLKYQRNNFTINFGAEFNAEVSFDKLPVSEISKDYIYALDENGNSYTPGFLIFNLKTQFQLIKGLSVNAGLENILDKRYLPYSSGIVAPGRNLVLSLVWRNE